MLDFNSSVTFSERITAFIDEALVAERAAQPQRRYLGASRIGHACERAIQYEYAEAPVDPGRELPGKIVRVFEVGHALEDLALRWLRLGGFELYTRKQNGEPFGFSVAGGRIQGHIDGILNSGPDALGLTYPALWECKTMNHKAWRETVKHRLAKAKPVYAAQVALYTSHGHNLSFFKSLKLPDSIGFCAGIAGLIPSPAPSGGGGGWGCASAATNWAYRCYVGPPRLP